MNSILKLVNANYYVYRYFNFFIRDQENMKHEMAEFTLCAPPGLSKVHFLNELLAKDASSVEGARWKIVD